MSVKEPVTSIYALKIAWYKLPLFRTGFVLAMPRWTTIAPTIVHVPPETAFCVSQTGLNDRAILRLWRIHPLAYSANKPCCRRNVDFGPTSYISPPPGNKACRSCCLKLYMRFLLSLLKHQTDTDTDPTIISSAPAIFKILAVDPSLRHAKLFSHVLTRYCDSFYLLAL